MNEEVLISLGLVAVFGAAAWLCDRYSPKRRLERLLAKQGEANGLNLIAAAYIETGGDSLRTGIVLRHVRQFAPGAAKRWLKLRPHEREALGQMAKAHLGSESVEARFKRLQDDAHARLVALQEEMRADILRRRGGSEVGGGYCSE